MFRSSVLVALCATLAVLLAAVTDGKSLTGEADGGEKAEVMFRRKREGGVTAAIIGAAITAGSSLAGTGATALMNTGYSVTAGIEIENYSKWIMGSPIAYNNAGYISTSPQPVHPAKREMMVAHKEGYTATGTYGTVSWNIQGTRAFVMWSAPYSFDFHTNWLGVGILPQGRSHQIGLFSDVYYSAGYGNNYRKAAYYRNIEEINFCNNEYCITGTMGSSHKTRAHIKVYPKSYDDLADSVKSVVSSTHYQSFLTSNGLYSESDLGFG